VEEISKRTLMGHQTNPRQNKKCVKKMDEAMKQFLSCLLPPTAVWRLR
jgi:hypothetical protein